MNGLMLHCGAESTDRLGVAALPVPAPMGPRHAIRPFIDDIEIVTESMADQGLTIKREAYGVTTKDGMPARYFGLIEVASQGAEFDLMVGLRGSYDQTLPRGLAVGSRIFVCDNLAFSGDIVFKTKQTTFVNDRIPAMLRDAISQVPAMAEVQSAKFDRYREVELVERQGNALLVEMMARGVLNPSQMGVAHQEWVEPRHAEHAQYGWSLWRLMNAMTEALKPANPQANAVQRNWGRTLEMTKALDEVAQDGFPVYH
jgi:hypothetical protein